MYCLKSLKMQNFCGFFVSFFVGFFVPKMSLFAQKMSLFENKKFCNFSCYVLKYIRVYHMVLLTILKQAMFSNFYCKLTTPVQKNPHLMSVSTFNFHLEFSHIIMEYKWDHDKWDHDKPDDKSELT